MVENYYTKEDNALTKHWVGSVWCSPPWGESTISDWVRHGREESEHGSAVVMLLPIRHLEDWWEDYVMQSSEVRVIQGELDFVPMSPVPNGVKLAVEAHCLVIFREGDHEARFSYYPAK